MRLPKFIYCFVIVALQIMVFSCASNKLRLPQEEISRPLSLPPRNWEIGLGAGIESRQQLVIDTNFPEIGTKSWLYRFEMPDGVFRWPYFQLGENWEYYLPARFKYYLLKNVTIKDSIVSITGTNIAISAGIPGIQSSFIYAVEVGIVFQGLLEYKQPLSEKVWLFNNVSSEYITFIQDFDFDIVTGIGYQISKASYITLSPVFSYYNVNVGWNNVGSRGYSVNIPVTIGFNITNKWKLYWRNSYSFVNENDLLRTTISDSGPQGTSHSWEIYQGIHSDLGFTYTW